MVCDFLVQFLGTVMGGIFLYLILNKPIENRIKEENKVKLLKNLAWDLGFNWVKTNKISEKLDEYEKADKFTANKYKTKNIIEFLAQRPISENERFPYAKLLALVDKLEQDNFLRDQVYDAHEVKAQQQNKKQYLKNVKLRKTETKEFLESIERFYKDRGLVLTEYS